VSDLAYWLALYRAPSVGSITFAKLINKFQSPQGVFNAGKMAWEIAGIKGALLEYLQAPDWKGVDQDLAWQTQEQNRWILNWQDADYPQYLRDIHDPPPILFGLGDRQILNSPQIAMVGSRNPSRGGEEIAFDFAKNLANLGWTITSGMALGIDAASHRGALSVNGKTLAVLGTGIDRLYPSSHRELALQIIDNGALISEFVTGTTAKGHNFPRRNRIISGLSHGTLVVEASLHSGSLITARQAAEQGREVFAIPGSIHNPLAKGCNALIKEGVKLVETVDDILSELGDFVQQCVPNANSQTAHEVPQLDQDYQQLILQMGIDEPLALDTLVERSGLTPEVISSMLLILELRGLVATASGGRYLRLAPRT
jgi:DNA processing protein